MQPLEPLVWLISSIIVGVSCEYLYQTEFLEVPVDHFTSINDETFQLRYLINDTYWDPKDGPIFFYTGNEDDINVFAQNTGFIWEIAPKFKALILFAEHRYYGISLPFGNKSFDGPEYFGYLTTEQALADFVDVVYHIKYEKYEPRTNDLTYVEVKEALVTIREKFRNPAMTVGNRDAHSMVAFGDQPRNPVITFGGSYGGMLAAWMRMKYPAVIEGALASSAPLWQFPTMSPCQGFMQGVTSSFRSSSPECVDNIRKSWDALLDVASTENGLAWLNENWKPCAPIKTTTDLTELRNSIATIYTRVAILNYPYPTNFTMPIPANPVALICEHLTDPDLADRNLLLAIFQAISPYFNHTGGEKCQNSPHNHRSNDDVWEIQTCIDLIAPACSNGVTDMFWLSEWNVDMFSDGCYQKYGIRPKSKVAEKEYGGKDVRTATNIIFSNGKLDPWISSGVTHSVSRDYLAIDIEKAAHHLDLRASNADDPRSVRQARIWYQHIFEKWIKDFHNTLPPLKFTFVA